MKEEIYEKYVDKGHELFKRKKERIDERKK